MVDAQEINSLKTIYQFQAIKQAQNALTQTHSLIDGMPNSQQKTDLWELYTKTRNKLFGAGNRMKDGQSPNIDPSYVFTRFYRKITIHF